MARDDAAEFTELAFGLHRAAGTVGARVAGAVTKTAFDIEGDAKILAPNTTGITPSGRESDSTGNLRNSVSTTITGDGRFGRIEAEIGPTADYGADVEYGTQPHDIPNAWGRGITVHHPGTAPQPYMRPAFERRAPGLEAALVQIGGEVLP